MIIIGTRPEAIKMAPIIKKCKRYRNIISPIIVVTSQHDELLKQALKIFEIKPHYNFEIMKKGQTLFDVTSKVLRKMENLLEGIHPDIILIQGDTTTVLACALAAYYKQIDVGHVEAGLRSFDKYNPFPEELNRRLAGVLADLHFAPTKTARDNLIKEGVNEKKIFITGNPIIDALFLILKKKWVNNLKEIDWNKKIILITVHRRESFAKGLINIAKALKKIATRNSEVEMVFPVHPNPNVRRVFVKILRGIKNIKLLEPLNYITVVNVMKRSTLILTDSGGIQEEAPSLGIPVLVLREVTERPEAVKAGCAKVIGTNEKNIIKETEWLLHNKNERQKMAKVRNPYGDGKAADRIINTILQRYNKLPRSNLQGIPQAEKRH